jgi:hypothetical protein
MATFASSSPTFLLPLRHASNLPLRHASNASATSPWSRQNSSGTSVLLNPLATLFAQASSYADRISMFILLVERRPAGWMLRLDFAEASIRPSLRRHLSATSAG